MKITICHSFFAETKEKESHNSCTKGTEEYQSETVSHVISIRSLIPALMQIVLKQVSPPKDLSELDEDHGKKKKRKKK